MKSGYLLSFSRSRATTTDNWQIAKNGVTHGFVAEFASAQDRDYYVNTDPTHRAFVNSIDGLVEKAIVVDFIDGVY